MQHGILRNPHEVGVRHRVQADEGGEGRNLDSAFNEAFTGSNVIYTHLVLFR